MIFFFHKVLPLRAAALQNLIYDTLKSTQKTPDKQDFSQRSAAPSNHTNNNHRDPCDCFAAMQVESILCLIGASDSNGQAVETLLMDFLGTEAAALTFARYGENHHPPVGGEC